METQMSALWFTIGFIAGMFTGVILMAALAAASQNWETYE
jgi:uncharacterized protein involved in exopolysaccharide biosynthesis